MEGDVPGRLVGQGKLWTQHPSGPGSPRAARDCASKLERDAGTVTAKYATHISSLLVKPYVIVLPSYVQLKEAFSPAGTRTGGSSHFLRGDGRSRGGGQGGRAGTPRVDQVFVTFPGRHTDTLGFLFN